jgi:hypothetical protein
MDQDHLDRAKRAVDLAWMVEIVFNRACWQAGISTRNTNSALAELGEREVATSREAQND